MLDPIVPFNLIDDHDLEEMVRLKEATGIHRIAVIGLTNNVRLTGAPGDEDYRVFAEKLRRLIEAATPLGIEILWWCLPTLKTGAGPYQRIVGIAGGESPISSCPLDERFLADYERHVAMGAKAAQPPMILLEDDLQLSNHPRVGFGCFCPLHLEKFRAYAGRAYTREELEALFTRRPLEAVELRRAWARMSRDTIVDFARRLRRAVDAVSPGTRFLQCEPGTTDLDGCLSREVPEALAGPATRPAIRIFGTQYGSTDTARDLPANLAHAMYEAEHLPRHFELYHESDTYPHNRFFSSAALMESILTAAMMIGCDSSLFIGAQYLDHHLEEFGYFDMYRRTRARLLEVQRFAASSALDGFQILYRPDFDFLRCRPVWEGDSAIIGLKQYAKLLGRMGFPYTTLDRKVKLLCGAAAEALSDDELTEIVRGGVLLDSEAASLLCRRGFGPLLGVQAELVQSLPAVAEYILDNAPTDLSRGRRIYNMAYAPSGSEGAQYARLELAGAEALTVYRGPGGAEVSPGLTRFVNRLGGRVAVMGCSILNESSNLFNYRKREVLRGLFTWLDDGTPPPAAVLDAPNLWLLFRASDREALIMATNLSADPVEDLDLALAPQWDGRQAMLLDADGQWRPADAEAAPGRLRVKGLGMHYLKPVLLRLA
jgi:hypothetical protein